MFRRDLKLFLHSLRTLVLLIVILLAGCVGTILAISGLETPEMPKPKLILCNMDTESQYGSTLLALASGHEMVGSLLDLSFAESEEEAMEEVRNGAVAAIILPEHFFSSSAHGESIPCKMILNSAGVGAKTVIESYAEIGSRLLTSGQLLVFTGDTYSMEHGFSDEEMDSFNLFMNIYAFSEFETARNRYFLQRDIPFTTSGLGKTAHYAAVYAAFFLSLLILGYYHLYQADQERGRLLMLRSNGIREMAFLRWKWIFPLFFSLILTTVFCIGASRFMPMTLTPFSILSALFGLLFIAVFGTLFSIAFSGISGAVLFSIHIVGLFFCGGIIPYSRLEPFLLAIGDFTPIGVAYRSIGTLFGGAFSVKTVLVAVAYVAAAYYACHHRILGVITGKGAA